MIEINAANDKRRQIFNMKRFRYGAQYRSKAVRRDWRWLLLCLLTGIGVLLAFAHAATAQMPEPALAPYATQVVSDSDSGCVQEHGSVGAHCHATVVCAGYAQSEAGPTSLHDRSRGHPLPIAQDSRDGHAHEPNLQPPKDSSQA
ncbi:MAG: hypothetical protein R3D05_03045 [Dongiaceae bacterium]